MDGQKDGGISLRKIVGIICFVIIFAAMAIMIMEINDKENTDSINIFGYRPVIVVSGSMEPEIQVNSVSIMQYCGVDDVDIGDVVMYRHPSLSINITHRVIDKYTKDGQTYLTTKGDANSEKDVIPISNGMLVGKIVKTYNNLVPYVSFIMLENGKVNTIALIQIILFIAVLITVAGICIWLLWTIISSFVIVAYSEDKFEEMMCRFDSSIFVQGKISRIVRDSTENASGIRSFIAKIILVREIKVFNESVKDLERVARLAQFIGGDTFTYDNNEKEDRDGR